MTTAVASAETAAAALQEAAAPQAEKKVRKPNVKSLVKAAARGETDKIKALLRPFLTRQERVVSCGLSAKMGLIPTYNFYFLTDRRVGDLEITPLTGTLNVESAFLHKIDAFAIKQPAITMLRVSLLLTYLFIAAFAFSLGLNLGGPLVGVAVAGLGVAVVKWVIAPALRRTVLRFRKSGIFIKLTGSAAGTYIFADRNNFGALSNLSRRITEGKRQLDKEAA